MLRSYFASIRTRLNFLVLLAILPGLGLSLFAYVKELQLRKAHVREQAWLLTRVVISHQEQLMTDTRQLLMLLAQLPQVRDRNPSACNSLLGNLSKQYPLYAAVGVVKPNGEVFCSSLTTKSNLADRLWFQETIRQRQLIVSDYQIGRISNKPVIIFGYPVVQSNAPVQSVVFASLDLAWLNQLIAKVQLPPNASLIVVDFNGVVLAHYPDSEKWVGKTFPDLPAIKTILAQGKGITEVNDVDGISRLYAFTRLNNNLPDAHVYMGIGISKAEPFAEAEDNLRRNLAVLLLVTIGAVAIIWIGGDLFIFHWVRRLTNVINRLAAGDLTARVGLEVPREMQQLANTFDRMATSLANQIHCSRIAEAELKKANERFALATAAVNAIIYDWDICNQTIERTQGLFDVLGYHTTEADPTDDWWYEQVHPSDRKWTRNQVAEALKSQNCEFSLEYRIRNRENRYLCVWEKGIIVRNPQGNAVRVVGSILDITQRKQAEAQISQLNATLEQQVQQRTAQLAATNQELESFSYSVSHDLRAPLRHIIGFTEALNERLEQIDAITDTKINRYIEVLQNSSQRMTMLIDGLLTLSRLGRKQLRYQSVDLNSLVKNAIALVSNQNDIDQAVEFKVGKLPIVMGDPTLLQQVFTNLIDNALKFSHNANPTVIQIDSCAEQTVFVKDNGVGFEMIYADQLFGAFQRLHSQRDFKGTGIGLAIVQRIIHRHGGKIWATSSPNQGATFYFKLEQIVEE